MRPGQNKRMRGRNNNGGNRKGPNPLTRSYESNGPDVKIRGTAQHIGEKYLQLARDAQTSGDPVAAESYLQHAEHYFRLIAAAQQAQYQAQTGYARPGGEMDGDDGEDEDDLVAPDRFALPSERPQPQPQPQSYVPQPQPYADRQNGGAERQDNQERGYRQDRPEGQDRSYRQDRQEGQERPYRQDRQEGQDRGYRQDRQDGQDRPYRQDRYGYDQRGGSQDRQGQPNYDRPDRNQFRGDRQNDRNNRQRFNRDDYRENRDFRDGNRDNRDPQYREQPRVNLPREQQSFEPRPQPVAPPAEAGPELPAFITAPVRTPAPVEPVAVEEPGVMPEPNEAASDAPGEQVALRPRRRRRPRVAAAGGFDENGSPADAPASED